MNTVFVKTTKAEREGVNLSNNLFRVLSLINGKSSSDELAKRASPSLRKTWDELLGELLKGGYVVENHEAVPGQNNALHDLDFMQAQETARVQPDQFPHAAVQPELDPVAKQKAEKAARAAELKAYFATAKEKARVEAEQAAHNDALLHAKLEAAAAVAKAGSNAEAKAKTEAKQKEEKAACARADLEAAIEVAKTRADALTTAKTEAKQREEEAARARAEHEATIMAAKAQTAPGAKSRTDAEAKAKVAAIQREAQAARARIELEVATAAAKASADAEAKAKAEAIQKEEETARARAEFEATILAAKTGPGSCSMAVAGDTGMAASEVARLHNLETENETLKKLLAEACVEIALLKNSENIDPAK